jgi:hypothetical protein
LGLKGYEQTARLRGLFVFQPLATLLRRRIAKQKSPVRGFFVRSLSGSKNRPALPAILPNQPAQK